MKFRYSIQTRYVEIKFDDKPAADIRGMLKAAGFRWSPSSGVWWRSRVEGAADFLAVLDKRLNPGRPDGACWDCQAPGKFRPFGAATPVYCDTCHAKHQAARQSQYVDPMGVDMAYEDACARACGL